MLTENDILLSSVVGEGWEPLIFVSMFEIFLLNTCDGVVFQIGTSGHFSGGRQTRETPNWNRTQTC